MLIKLTIATNFVSPAPRKQPEITTCEVCKWVIKATIIRMDAPMLITSGLDEKRETKKCLPK